MTTSRCNSGTIFCRALRLRLPKSSGRLHLDRAAAVVAENDHGGAISLLSSSAASSAVATRSANFSCRSASHENHASPRHSGFENCAPTRSPFRSFRFSLSRLKRTPLFLSIPRTVRNAGNVAFTCVRRWLNRRSRCSRLNSRASTPLMRRKLLSSCRMRNLCWNGDDNRARYSSTSNRQRPGSTGTNFL